MIACTHGFPIFLSHLGKVSCALENLADSEVAEDQPTVAEKENVLCFEVAVEDPAGVHVVKAKRHLNKVVQNLGLCEELFAGLLDDIGEVTTVTELHHDAQGVPVLRHERIAVATNVGVI